VGDSLRPTLRLVVVFAVLAALPAMLVPASAANLGLADTADGLPVAPHSLQTFPVVSAVGLMWEQARPEDPPVDHYIVKRQRHNGHWEDVSPPLTETHWLDTSVAPGESNEYYVVAVNAEGEGPGGGIITGTRPVADPAVGSINALVVDAGPGIAGSVLTTEVAEPVTASERQGSVRYLSAGDIRIKIPALIPGPGYYDLAPHSEFEIEQNGITCPNLDYPKLKVSELLYTQDLRLAMMAAEFQLTSCGNGGPQTDYGAIRVDSTEPYSAIAVTPTTLDFGRVRRGTTAERSVTLTNTGMTSLTISAAQVAYGYEHVWQARNECTEPLAPGAACAVVVGFTPDSNLSRDARIRITDSTARGTRFVDASGMGESVPFAPDVDVWRTFTGIDVSWSAPGDTGGWPLTGFVVHRTAGGTTTQYPLPVEQHRWIDPDPPAGASYSVSAVNQLGEGWASQPQSPAAAREQLTMFTGRTTQQAVLSGVAIWHGSQPVPVGTSAPAGTRTEVTTSPDGRHLAYTLGDGENQVLWISRLDGTGSRKLWEVREIHDPSWSPDGTRIAFTTHVDASTPCVDIVNAVDGGTPVRVGCGIEFPAWHPDAQTLLVRDQPAVDGAPQHDGGPRSHAGLRVLRIRPGEGPGHGRRGRRSTSAPRRRPARTALH
jgi:WD40-like Beta Propeller Repeat